MERALKAGAPNWGWGSGRQLLACRVSQILGLLAVLALLWSLNVTL